MMSADPGFSFVPPLVSENIGMINLIFTMNYRNSCALIA